jgi:CHAD domain-containing protein
MRGTSPSELLIRQRLSALTRALPGARHGDATSLHQARVATRRLRETILLVASGERRRKLERKVRGLTRALGPVRELDVALQILDELAQTGEVPSAAVRCLRLTVLEERKGLQHEMLRRLDRCNLEKLRKRAVAASRRTHGKAASTTRKPHVAAGAVQRAARRAETLRTSIESAAGLYLPDRLHDVRIAVKKLRYALELSGAVSPRGSAARIRTLTKAQDLLGRMHDLEVLIARTRGVQGSSSAPTLKLSGELDRLVRRLENECRQLHGHYITLRKALVHVCDQAIAAHHRREQAA